MLVVVITMHRVLVTIVDVIDVVAVRDRLVPAVATVLVLGGGVLGRGVMLVVVAIVLGVTVPVVQVVDVVAMLHGRVTAVAVVVVLGGGVVLFVGEGAHDRSYL